MQRTVNIYAGALHLHNHKSGSLQMFRRAAASIYPKFTLNYVAMNTALNNAQLEILPLFASDLSDAELMDLRRLLIDFRYARLQQGIDG